MKKNAIRKILLFFLILTLFSFNSSAHSGRTDAYGGHHDYDNVSGLGDYHYHHGKPAHLHENGICPYDNETKSQTNNVTTYPNSSYGSSVGSGSYKSSGSYKRYEGTEPHVSSKKEEKELPLLVEIIVYLILGFFVSYSMFGIFSLFVYFADSFKNKRAKRRKKKMQEELNLLAEKSAYDHYFSMYAFFRPSDFCKIPRGTYLKDSLPCTHGGGIYGEYTAYITPTGKCFHQKRSCVKSENITETNIVFVYKTHRCCSKCCKFQPNLGWYYKWLKIREIKKQYNIP